MAKMKILITSIRKLKESQNEDQHEVIMAYGDNLLRATIRTTRPKGFTGITYDPDRLASLSFAPESSYSNMLFENVLECTGVVGRFVKTYFLFLSGEAPPLPWDFGYLDEKDIHDAEKLTRSQLAAIRKYRLEEW